jgi:rhamnosyl/mannosyltransferase
LPTGVPWVNQHKATGLVVAPGSPSGLRQAIVALIENPEYRNELGQRARARVLSAFTADEMIARTTSLYQELLQPGAQVRAVAAEPARV